MGFKEFFATGKGKIITIGGGVTVLAAGIAAAVLLQGDGFRSIMVQDVTGTVEIVGDKNNGTAYVGENLYSGDDVTVREDSELVMCMDNDKYVYADANTHFILKASDANEDSKIEIFLDKGSELNELQSKLGPNDTYKVDTPNSTLAVRGTTFRVTVYDGEDGKTYTLLEVEEGVVEVELKTTDGVYTGVKQTFTAGQSALVRADASISEFLVGDENEVVLRLNYAKLPEEAVPRLVKLVEAVDGNVIKGDLELQGEDDEEEEQVEEPTPTPTPTPEVELVPEPDGDGPDGDGDGDGIGTEAGNADGAIKRTRAHVHTPGGWMTSQAATCLMPGMRMQLCTTCNEPVAAEAVSRLSHRMVDGICVLCGYGTPAPEESVGTSDSVSSDSVSSESTPCDHHGARMMGGLDDYGKHLADCSKCGQIVSIDHYWKPSEVPNSDGIAEPLCMCTVGGETVAHDGTPCSRCGYTGTCAHPTTTFSHSTHDYHIYLCTVCGSDIASSHDFPADGVYMGQCNVCNYNCTHLEFDIMPSDTGHTKTCKSCRIEISEAHQWSTPVINPTTGQHEGDCTVCGVHGIYNNESEEWTAVG